MLPPMTPNEKLNFDSIVDAMQKKKCVIFSYKSQRDKFPTERFVEPFLIGVNAKTGKYELRAWDLYELTRDNWKLYTLDGIDKLGMTANKFTGKRPSYNPIDSAMSDILANV